MDHFLSKRQLRESLFEKGRLDSLLPNGQAPAPRPRYNNVLVVMKLRIERGGSEGSVKAELNGGEVNGGQGFGASHGE